MEATTPSRPPAAPNPSYTRPPEPATPSNTNIQQLKKAKYTSFNVPLKLPNGKDTTQTNTEPSVQGMIVQQVVKKGSNLQPTVESLKSKNIGVLQGSVQETFAKKHWEPQGVTITPYQDQNQVYNDMVAGRLDGTLVMSAAGQSGFLEKPQGKEFAFAGGPVEDTQVLGVGIGFGLRKDDTQRKQELDAAIAKVQADGTVTKLAAKFFPGIDVAVKE